MYYDSNWVLNFRTPSFTQFFQLCPYLVSDYFLIGIFALFYWSSSRTKPYWMDLGFIIVFSTIINRCLKEVFAVARPSIEKLVVISDNSYSFPSGDVQVFTVVALMIAYYFKSTLAWIIAIIMIVLVAISRVYLGAHFPVDVVGGALVGYASFLIYKRYFINSLVLSIVQRNIILQGMLYGLISITYFLIMQKHFGKLDIVALGSLTGMWLGFMMLPKNMYYRALNLMTIIFGFVGMVALLYLLRLIPQYFEMIKGTKFIFYFLITFFITYLVPQTGKFLSKK